MFIPKKVLLILSKEINYEIQVSDKIFFEKNVTKAVQAIIRNEFEKVVLSRRESIELSYFDFELSFRKLLQNYESAFNYCFYRHLPCCSCW